MTRHFKKLSATVCQFLISIKRSTHLPCQNLRSERADVQLVLRVNPVPFGPLAFLVSLNSQLKLWQIQFPPFCNL